MVAGRSNTEIRQSDSRCISNSKVFTAFMSRRHHLTDDSSDDTGRKSVTWLLWEFVRVKVCVMGGLCVS